MFDYQVNQSTSSYQLPARPEQAQIISNQDKCSTIEPWPWQTVSRAYTKITPDKISEAELVQIEPG